MIWHLHSIPWHSFWGTVIDSASSSIMALSAPRVVSRFFGVDLDGQWWLWKPGESYLIWMDVVRVVHIQGSRALLESSALIWPIPEVVFHRTTKPTGGPRNLADKKPSQKSPPVRLSDKFKDLGPWKSWVVLNLLLCLTGRVVLNLLTPVNSVNTSFTMRKQLRCSKVRQSVPVVT